MNQNGSSGFFFIILLYFTADLPSNAIIDQKSSGKLLKSGLEQIVVSKVVSSQSSSLIAAWALLMSGWIYRWVVANLVCRMISWMMLGAALAMASAVAVVCRQE